MLKKNIFYVIVPQFSSVCRAIFTMFNYAPTSALSLALARHIGELGNYSCLLNDFVEKTIPFCRGTIRELGNYLCFCDGIKQ